MREDAIGLFWEDKPKEKRIPKPPSPKRTPPEPVWLSPDYLPGLEEAQAFDVDLYTDAELAAAAQVKEPLTFDIEIYSNYFLVAFQGVESGKLVYFETDAPFFCLLPEQITKIKWILANFLIVGFNSNSFDIYILALALAGVEADKMKIAADKIIKVTHKFRINYDSITHLLI